MANYGIPTDGADNVKVNLTTSLPAGSAAIGSVTVSNLPATQPVSGTVTATGPLTNTELRAAAVPVSGDFYPATQTVSGTVNVGNFPSTQAVTGTFWQTTQPVSAASLPLPSGAATETTLSALNTKVPAQGQATMAASQPVVIASNQTAVPVSGTFFQATQPVSIATMPTTPVTGTFWQATQPVSAVAMTDGTQRTQITNGTTNAGVEAFGALQVNTGPSTLFYDAWSTSPIDTTDKWTVTGTAPTIATGMMTMVATPSTYNAIRTKDTVRPNAGFTHVRNGIRLEGTAATGAGRFWGLGTPATTPAPAVLVQDGVGFEIDQATGALLAVTYAAGVRTTVATLTRPTDNGIHAYGVSFRATRAYWFVDNMQVQVAEFAFPTVQVVELPALIVRQNAASFTGTPEFVNIAHLTADTSGQGVVLADPVIGTRQARVHSDGSLRVSASSRTTRAVAVASTPRSTVTQAADAATAGRWWLINPVGSTTLIALRRVEFTSAPTAVTAFPTSPRVTVERVTFTGTATGAQITPVQRDTTDTALVGTLRSASTGLTLAAGAVAYAFTVVPILTGVGASVPSMLEWEPSDSGQLVLRAGQGIVIRQADGGSASDTRVFNVNLAWEEYV